eukprot:280867-Chlamydomonas_euryale.AAC.1
MREPTVGRMWHVHPNGEDKECYFLRLLLTIRPGMKSWEDWRTVDGTIYATFKEACEAMHLLDDDADIHATMDEAVTFQMPTQLLELFAFYLTNDMYNGSPCEFWVKYRTHLMEGQVAEFRHRERLTHVSSPRDPIALRRIL